MQGLAEDTEYIYQGKIPMSGEDDAYQWICVWCLRSPLGLINQQETQLNRSESSLQIYKPQSIVIASPWQI